MGLRKVDEHLAYAPMEYGTFTLPYIVNYPVLTRPNVEQLIVTMLPLSKLPARNQIAIINSTTVNSFIHCMWVSCIIKADYLVILSLPCRVCIYVTSLETSNCVNWLESVHQKY